MAIEKQNLEQLLSENQRLQLRLAEAEEMLTAIQNGEVDALVISRPEGEQIFSLKGAEHAYRVMVESMYEGAVFLISTGQIFYSNQQLAMLLQLPMEKLIGTQFTDYVATQDLALVTERLQNFNASQLNRDEITLKTRQGQLLTVLLSWSRVEFDDKLGLSVVITDISARKLAEQKILRLNRLYAMINAINLIIHTKDRDQLFKDFCQIAVQQGGFRLAWVALLNPDTGQINVSSAAGETHYLDGLQLNLQSSPVIHSPTSIAIRTGSHCIYNDFLEELEKQPLYEKARQFGLLASASVAIKENNITIGALSLYTDEKDYFDEHQIQLLMKIGEDISFTLDNLILESNLNETQQQLQQAQERERTAELLSESERLLSESQRISHIGSWSYDFINPIIWSEETYRLFGVSADSFIPTEESLAFLIHVDDRLAMQAYIGDFAQGNNNQNEFIFRNILPDGNIRYLSAKGQLLKDKKGHGLRMVGTAQDITEHYLNEQILTQSEERLRMALNAAKLGVFDWDILTNQVILSPRSEEILGYEPGQFSGLYDDFIRGLNLEDLPSVKTERSLAERSLAERSLAERSLAERSLAERSLAERSLAEQTPYAYESHMLWPDGSVHWISVIGEYYADTKDQRLHVRGIVEDITHRKVTENSLKLAASVFTHSREGIIITDADATIIDVNDSFTYITGYSHAEALGQNPSLLKSNRNEPAFFEKLWQDLLTKKHWYGEIWNRHKNGDDYVIMINISAVLNNLGDTQSYVALFSDITATKSHQQQLEHIANYDALTGLPNRLLLADRLEQAIIQSQRQGNSLALVYLDLDGFKAVNDQYGHTIGDALLINISQRMRTIIREIDTLARIGGDEFVVVLVNLESQSDCEPLLDRLLRATSDPVIVDGLILQVSASIGVTLYPKDNVDADRLLRHADHAMYGAKQSGKNRYLYFDLIHNAALKSEQENLARIRSAMDNREFVLYYQPKVNMKTGQVIGAEALIRWQHPEQGLLLPATFLPIINNHAYDIELGEWVLDTAFTQLSEWCQQNFTISVSVNIGAHHLQNDYFIIGLSNRFAAHPTIHPNQIELEILESSALEDLNNASNIMKSCCELGVHFALDDFGTGYSSLTYLKRLPVNMLKIDQSFVRDMLIDLENLPIIEGVIGLAKAFHHQVIAEGVETPTHCERLLEMSCDLAQGYAIARPMPANQLADWVKDWHQQSSWTMQ